MGGLVGLHVSPRDVVENLFRTFSGATSIGLGVSDAMVVGWRFWFCLCVCVIRHIIIRSIFYPGKQDEVQYQQLAILFPHRWSGGIHGIIYRFLGPRARPNDDAPNVYCVDILFHLLLYICQHEHVFFKSFQGNMHGLEEEYLWISLLYDFMGVHRPGLHRDPHEENRFPCDSHSGFRSSVLLCIFLW